ncbi:hypothetical protein [Teredinibacter turnerae]|uniref:hypothetical protein n=1 Tax=Teredinibacter turnerae TaxID=2426 RepID=UPI000376F572|nr:hypothetical protein [Teredinibacter turnerae]
MISRRKLLLLAAYGASYSAASAFAESEKLNAKKPFVWEKTASQWLALFLPENERGRGADCAEVWGVLNKYLNDKEFKDGFIGGLKTLSEMPMPKNQRDLGVLMNTDYPISKFIRAFFDVTLEAYYSSSVGWSDIGVTHSPQPIGYTNFISGEKE